MGNIWRYCTLVIVLGCASEKSFKGTDVLSFCDTQQVWMEGCSLDETSFSSGSCEEGILSVVEGCEEYILSLYGEAYSSFYSCLQEESYCPEIAEDTNGFSRCTTEFDDAVGVLELDCLDSVDGNNGSDGYENIEPEPIGYEEPPVSGESIVLLDDQRIQVALEEPFGGHTSFSISSNGLVQFGGEDREDCCFGQPLIPSSDHEVIAITWADLNPEESGDIRWEIYNDDIRGKALVVVYESVSLCCASQPAVTAWMRFWEDDKSVEIHIGNVQSEYPVTIGVQYSDVISVLPEHHAQEVNIAKESWLYTPQIWSE